MRLIWDMAFATLAIFLVVVVPATIFYYEAKDDDAGVGKAIKRHVLCNMIFMLIFLGSALGISYAFLSEAAIPVKEYACPSSHWVDGAAVLTPQQIGSQV